MQQAFDEQSIIESQLNSSTINSNTTLDRRKQKLSIYLVYLDGSRDKKGNSSDHSILFLHKSGRNQENVFNI